MRRLSIAINVSLDGYVAAPGDDLGWSVASDEVFQWWSDRVSTTDTAFTALDNWVDLILVKTHTFPGGLLLTRYETRH